MVEGHHDLLYYLDCQLQVMSGKYLEEGPRTQVDDSVKEFSENISAGSDIEFVYKVLLRVQEEFEDIGDVELLEKRSSVELFEDRTLTGCSDYVHVLVPLVREYGIPARVVRGIEKESIPVLKRRIRGEEVDEEVVYEGHVVAECKVDDRWITVDPARGKINLFPATSEGSEFRERYEGIETGIDSWEMGINSFEGVKEYHSDYVKQKYELG